jgi:hypothetical protein
MAQLVIRNTVGTPVLVIPCDTIRECLSTVFTSSCEIADADFSCALRSICCEISREKTSVLQPFKYPSNLILKYTKNIRKIYEKFLVFIFSFFFLNFLPHQISSAVHFLIKFETKTVTYVLSVLGSKVRNAGIEIYYITSSEKFQGN